MYVEKYLVVVRHLYGFINIKEYGKSIFFILIYLLHLSHPVLTILFFYLFI